MEPIETTERGACTIELHYDTDPMSPSDWTQLGTIVNWGRDGGAWGNERRRYEPMDTHYSWPRWAAEERRDRGATVILPLYVGRGDGVSVGTQAGWWDGSYPDGCIFDTPKGREDCGTPADLIAEVLTAEVAEWDTYFRGEVYGYVVERDGATVDSCWGFYGDDGLKMAREDAEAAADHETAQAITLGSYELAH